MILTMLVWHLSVLKLFFCLCSWLRWDMKKCGLVNKTGKTDDGVKRHNKVDGRFSFKTDWKIEFSDFVMRPGSMVPE